MRIRYELYVVNEDYDDHCLQVTDNLPYAKTLRDNHIRNNTPVTVAKTDEDMIARTITFAGKPGIDKWQYWTDSHGRPAKRFIRTIIQGET